MGKSNASAKKLQEVILAKTTESLNEEKTTKKSNKAAAKKTTTSEEAIIVKPLKEKKSKKVAPVKEEKTTSKKETKKAIEKKPKELKYIYPEDCKDSLAKKKFRAETRAKVRHYNKELSGLKEGSKEYKATLAKFNAFQKERGLLRA